MRLQLCLLSIVLVCLSNSSSNVSGKTVFRRTDKISENFKQLDLQADEIDPNVAPPAPVQQDVDTIDPEEVAVTGSSSSPSAAVEEVVEDVAEDPAELVGTANADAVDETINEVEDAVASAVTSAPAPVPAPAAASAAASAAPAATAKPTTTAVVNNVDDPSAISKYCKCTDSHCDCCRNFGLPLIPVRGPGCAKITYLGNEKMSVSIKYGDITLATRTISGKNAKPICVGLPGGYSKFCGRIYGLSKAKENFKACLGFELRAEDEIEAALRVSCFKFGPGGLRVAESEPLPSEVNKEEDDDDDDIFGFAAGGDDEDEEDYDAEDDDDTETAADAADDDDDDYADDEETEAPEDADYGGFSLGGLLAELADDDEETTAANAAAAVSSSSNKPAIAAVTAGATRIASSQKEIAQSKNDKGTASAASTDAVTNAAEAVTSLEEAAVAAVATPAPAVAAADSTATTVKTKKSKKAKKNKKKKAANTESDYAYEIINGILDFFN